MTLLLRAVPYMILLAIGSALTWGVWTAGARAGYSSGQTAGYELGRTAGYDSGHRAGDKAGYERGVRDAQKLHDAAMLTLLAESRAEAEKTLREAHGLAEEEKRRGEAAIASARLEYAGVAAHRDRILVRLRAVPARDPVRPADDRGGLPPAGAAGDGSAVPAGALPEQARVDLADLAADADWANGQFAVCHRYAGALKRHERPP